LKQLLSGALPDMFDGRALRQISRLVMDINLIASATNHISPEKRLISVGIAMK
jgi:hypothetical protein